MIAPKHLMSDHALVGSAARLSISALEAELDNPRKQVAELLRGSSVASLPEEAVDQEDGEVPDFQSKRRRSSVQSFSIPSGTGDMINVGKNGRPKKIHKKKLKKALGRPELKLLPKNDDKRVGFKKLRDLALTVFHAHDTGNDKNKWFQLENARNIPNVVFCLVSGLQLDILRLENAEHSVLPIDLVTPEEELPFLHKTFKDVVLSMSPGSKDSFFSPLHAITNIPLTKQEKKAILDKLALTPITILDLILNNLQLRTFNYPSDEKDGTWVSTFSFEHEGSRTFALDCEFCQAASGQVLTRALMVNFTDEVVFDMFVKPEEEITDYVTKYSGITEEKLQDVTTTLKEVQEKILSVVSKDDILIGHSLESDLNVMKIVHEKVVDTSVIYEHSRGPPSKPSLKWLCQKYLARKIQQGEVTGEGHSSVEDAQACLDLVKLKIIEGRCFGLNIGEVSLFQRLSTQATSDGIVNFRSLLLGYAQYKDQEQYKEPEEHKATKLYANNDDEIVDQFIEEVDEHQFSVLSLKELEYNLRWSNAPEHFNGLLFEKPAGVDKFDFELTEEQRSQLYQRTNNRLQKIYYALPENSLMIVFSNLGSPFELLKLQDVKRKFQSLEKDGKTEGLPRSEVWDFDKQLLLYETCAAAKDAVAFIALKTFEEREIKAGQVDEEKDNLDMDK